jgi:carbamoyl-phosphate synthase small subunit
LNRNISITRVPWDYDFKQLSFDGIVVSNGPGDPQNCTKLIINLRHFLTKDIPILGICLGHQLLALASGASTFKMKFGHRGQNQPSIEIDTKRCFITSQNHGFAVNVDTLNNDWRPWFINANDGTNEGIRHIYRPFFGVQFHPEASPGPRDVNFIFDMFVDQL